EHLARSVVTHFVSRAIALRILERDAVDFGSAGIQKARAYPNRQFEQVTRAFAVYAHRLDREARVARRTGRTREVVDPLDLDFGRAFYQVQVEQLEARRGEQVSYVRPAAGEEVVGADHCVSLIE